MPTYQKIMWIGLTVATLAILVLGYFLFLAPVSEKGAVTVPNAAVAAEPPGPAAPVAGEVSDPDIVPLDLDLDQSDGPVRELVEAEEIPPALRGWLRQKEIVRTVVAVVDNIARGQSPAALLPFLAPAEPFQAGERDGGAWLDPRSFRRYDSLVNAFTAVPDRTWITWFRTLRPTLEKAFRELGYPGITFAQRVQQAAEQLLQTPLPRGEVALERKVLSYAFVDPNLENLNAAQKHLLRLGPANMARVQGKVRSLAAAIRRPAEK